MDGEGPQRFRITLAAAANGRYQGGGIAMAPEAAIDDGLLDVTLVEPVSLAEVAVHVKLLYSGELLTYPKVRHWKGARLRAESDGEVPLELDGEPVGTLPLEAEVWPGAWMVIR